MLDKTLGDLFKTERFAHASTLLIVPPFIRLTNASLGVHILQACAKAKGHHVTVLYANVFFAKLIGKDLYNAITFSTDKRMLGDRVFSDAAYDKNTFTPAFEQAYRAHPETARLEGLKVYQIDYEELVHTSQQTKAFSALLAKHIVNSQINVVGCTSMFNQTAASIAFLKAIKLAASELPNRQIATLIGGANCAGEMAHGIASLSSHVDYIFSGESEQTFVAFLQKLTFEQNENILLKTNRARIITGERCDDLDSIPTPEFTDYYDQIDASEIEFDWRYVHMPYESSRGCWWGQKYQCTFCGVHELRYRTKSAQRVLQELAQLLPQHRSNYVNFCDDIMPMQYFKTLLPHLQDTLPGIRFFIDQKANLSFAKVRALKEAGVYDILPGIETLSTELLTRIDKGVNAKQNLQMMRYARGCDLQLSWYFLFGIPGETPAQYQAMLQLLPLIRHLCPPMSFQDVKFLRFGLYVKQPEKHGVTQLKPLDIYHEILPDNADIKSLAYYFEGEYDSIKNLAPALATQIETEVAIWRDTWYQSSHYSNIPCLHITAVSPEQYLLTDTRFQHPVRLFIDEAQAASALIAQPLNQLPQGWRAQWALENNLAVKLDEWLVPLATTTPALFEQFENRYKPARQKATNTHYALSFAPITPQSLVAWHPAFVLHQAENHVLLASVDQQFLLPRAHYPQCQSIPSVNDINTHTPIALAKKRDIQQLEGLRSAGALLVLESTTKPHAFTDSTPPKLSPQQPKEQSHKHPQEQFQTQIQEQSPKQLKKQPPTLNETPNKTLKDLDETLYETQPSPYRAIAKNLYSIASDRFNEKWQNTLIPAINEVPTPFIGVIVPDLRHPDVIDALKPIFSANAPMVLLSIFQEALLVSPYLQNTEALQTLQQRLLHNAPVLNYLYHKPQNNEHKKSANEHKEGTNASKEINNAHKAGTNTSKEISNTRTPALFPPTSLPNWLNEGRHIQAITNAMMLHLQTAEPTLSLINAQGDVQRFLIPALNQPTQPDFAKQMLAPIELTSALIAHECDGGFRHIPPQETVNKLTPYINPVVGYITHIEPLSTHVTPLEPVAITPYKTCFFKTPPYADESPITDDSFVQTCLGKGVSQAQSQASALCEAIERLNAQFTGEEPHFLATPFELEQAGKTYYRFGDLAPYSTQQYRDFSHTCDNSLIANVVEYDDQAIHWCQTWSLTKDKPVYVPLSCGFANAPCHHTHHKASHFGRWHSNGAAAGNTQEEAILQGMLEVIERDAVAIWWYNQIPRPAFDLTRLKGENLKAFAHSISIPLHAEHHHNKSKGKSKNEGKGDETFQAGRKYTGSEGYKAGGKYTKIEGYKGNGEYAFWVLDITHDIGIPVMVAVGQHIHHGGFILGFGCHFQPELAAQRALTELCQLIPIRDSNKAQFDFDDIQDAPFLHPSADVVPVPMCSSTSDSNSASDSASASASASNQPNYAFIQKKGETTDIKQSILQLVDTLDQLGYETLILNYTRPPIPLHTIKVFIPGLCHIWPQLGNPRLYQVPVNMGWRKNAPTENTLNPLSLYI